MSRTAILLFLAVLAILARPAAAGPEGLAEMKRIIRLEARGDGFAKKLKGVVSNARVKSIALLLDWWGGPEDDRVGDPNRARKGGFVFEVRHGRKWHALPEAERDLDLEARVEAPKGVLEGEAISGEWLVRQKGGDDPVRDVRIEITFLVPWGKGLAQPDLLIENIVFDDLESETPPEGSYPLKRDFPALEAGKSYPARVHLANRGYGDVQKPEIALFLTRLDGKGRKALPPATVRILLREGEEMRVKWVMPVPRKLGPGLYLLHAAADPRRRANELDEENNEFARVVRITESGK